MFFEKRRFSIEFNFQIKDFFLDEIPTNPCSSWGFVLPIIPYQVITGNYNKERDMNFGQGIIPYQVITGNYNNLPVSIRTVIIIPYQVITGNYNTCPAQEIISTIIPYQVITGNYNLDNVNHDHCELYHTK